MNKLKARICGFSSKARLGDFYPLLSQFDDQIEFSSPNDAALLFVTQHPKSFRELFSITDKGQIRVFIGLEAQSPDMNIFDYAISFDSTITGDRNFRPHTLVTFESFLEYGSLDFAQSQSFESVGNRDGFCDFIYGNRNAHPTRDNIFHHVNARIGAVSSYGSHLRNAHFSTLGVTVGAPQKDWKREKIEVQKRHIFSIAAENACFTGYTTEKLLTPLIAGSIPIYWGNPRVSDEFNPDRFIIFDGADYGQLEVEVRQLLEDPELIEAKTREPALTTTQLEALEQNRKDMHAWFGRLFAENLKVLQRRPRGWFPDWYVKMLRSAYVRQSFSQARFAGVWRSIFGNARN